MNKNTKLGLGLSLIAVLMFGFGYMLVPIYNVMCKKLGINGKIDDEYVLEDGLMVDKSRTIIVEFLATNNQTLPWDFYPNIRKLKMHPGEMKRISYHAKNNSEKTMMIQAIPSVSPGLAAKYLKKTECFCFTQQTLGSKKTMDMPILFHLDPALPKDISTVTVSYTVFDITNFKVKTSTHPGRIAA